METKKQGVTAAPGAVGQEDTCEIGHSPGVDRAEAAGRRDEAIRMLSELGWRRHAIAAHLGVTIAVVARAQRAGGAS